MGEHEFTGARDKKRVGLPARHNAQLSEGVKYVFVNGQLTFDNGKLTGAAAGRALRGPGAK